MAANARIAMTVAPSSGIAVCLTTSIEPFLASIPFSRRTSTPSTTTMALSTSMPSAIISAPREIRSSATSIGAIKMKVPAIVTISTKPISMPLRSPMKNSSTIMTMATASSKLITKPLMATVTASDCIDTIPASMPTGSCPRNVTRRCSRASPILTTLPPATVEMPSPIAVLPS